MPQINIRHIHDICQTYLESPILKPFKPEVSTEPQSLIDKLNDIPPKEKSAPEVIDVYEKKKIVQEILRADAVTQVADILDRCDHGTMTNREFLQKTHSTHLSWLVFRQKVEELTKKINLQGVFLTVMLMLYVVGVSLEVGMAYILATIVAIFAIYALLRTTYAFIQIHQASLAFAKLNQSFITELETSVEQDYSVEPITQLLQKFDLAYDQEGKWIDHIIEDVTQFKNKKLPDGSVILHVLLTYQNPNASYATVKKLQKAVSLLSEQKYSRNSDNATPLYTLNSSDIYGLKYFLDTPDKDLFRDQHFKINSYLRSLIVDRKHAKGMLLFEGVSGTGKSQAVAEYLEKHHNYIVHRWEAGGSGDSYVGGLEARGGAFFDDIIEKAENNPQEKHLIYLDDIDVICGTRGEDTKSWTKALAGQFGHRINKIRYKCTNVVVVATTRSALSVDASLLDNSERVRFYLPDENQRRSLLLHAFIGTRVSQEQIFQLAQVTEGWSHRALTAIPSSLDRTLQISDQNIEDALEKVRTSLEQDFTATYPHTKHILPKYLKTNTFLNYKIVTPPPIAECLEELKDYLLNPTCYVHTPMHVLLYGPPGGGKTTAIRNFCEEINLPFVVVKSGISANGLSKVFETVNEYKYAVVFIDEIDTFPHTGELLKQMDGFSENKTIVIGATNKAEQVVSAGEGALGDRFHFKIYVPGLTKEQRANFIKWKINEQLTRSNNMLMPAADLQTDQSCLDLAEYGIGLSMRTLAHCANGFFGRLHSKAIHSSAPETVSTAAFADALKKRAEEQKIKTFGPSGL